MKKAITPKKIHENPVSDKHVELFHGFVKKWQTKLNLNDWRIEPGTLRSSYMAEVTRKLPDRLARYRVGEHFGAAKVTPASLESCALHEVLHVFVHELVEFAKANTSVDDVMSAEHRVINTLEKLLLESSTETK